MSPQISFFIVNVIGGIAVLGSYAMGIGFFPEYRDDLWGGVQGRWKTALTVSMLLAATGYITFCYFALTRDSGYFFGSGVFLGEYFVPVITAVFLLTAALWMPATITYMHTNDQIWWFITVGLLWATAVSLVILTATVSLSESASISYIEKMVSMAGLLLITAHCLFMDAVTWVQLFHRH